MTSWQLKLTYTINTANMETWEMMTHRSRGGLNIRNMFRMAPEKPPAAPSVLMDDIFITWKI